MCRPAAIRHREHTMIIGRIVTAAHNYVKVNVLIVTKS